MDIKTKQLLRISDRGLILMNKSKIYKNKIEIAIQGF